MHSWLKCLPIPGLLFASRHSVRPAFIATQADSTTRVTSNLNTGARGQGVSFGELQDENHEETNTVGCCHHIA